jgi:hypothetical protein
MLRLEMISLENNGEMKALTSNIASRRQVFSKSTFPVNIEIITHKTAITEQAEASSLFSASENLMTIVANLGVRKCFFIVFPEPLDTPGTLVLVSHVIAPGTLNSRCHIMPVPITHCFQCKKLQAMEE